MGTRSWPIGKIHCVVDDLVFLSLSSSRWPSSRGAASSGASVEVVAVFQVSAVLAAKSLKLSPGSGA